MEASFGTYYVNEDNRARKLPDNTGFLAGRNIWRFGSETAADFSQRFRERLSDGEVLYLLGYLGTAHNSGVALVEVSTAEGVRTLTNCEEERFAGVKHYSGYPERSIHEVGQILRDRKISPKQITCINYGFDVLEEERSAFATRLENPKIVKGRAFSDYVGSVEPKVSLDKDESDQVRKNMFSHSPSAASAIRRLKEDLGLSAGTPCFLMPHHENHAYAAYYESPFSRGLRRKRPTLVACFDGGGDNSSTSIFVARDTIKLLRRNDRSSSVETFFLLCGIMFGGWNALNPHAFPRSDNRLMAAAMHGNMDRLTNPLYRQARQYFYFGPDGALCVNTHMSNDSMGGLRAIFGSEIDDTKSMCGDAERFRHRADIAAAIQLTVEDALFHQLASCLIEEDVDQLVVCGQVALNTVANMRLLEHFDEGFYNRNGMQGRHLDVWVSPNSADQGAVVGAAYQFAVCNELHTVREAGPAMCGQAYNGANIEASLQQHPRLNSIRLGNLNDGMRDFLISDWLAFLVAQNNLVGLFQGPAENGARALGNRSLLFNPWNPDAQNLINTRLKKREPYRLLSPMLTLHEAKRRFVLSKGAASDAYDAYRYMMISALARPGTEVPGIVGPDGTARIQIAQEHNDAFLYRFLMRLEFYTGAQMCINTSMNVETPIVQTPSQAMDLLTKTAEIASVFFVSAEKDVYISWADAGSTEGLMKALRSYKKQQREKCDQLFSDEILRQSREGGMCVDKCSLQKALNAGENGLDQAETCSA